MSVEAGNWVFAISVPPESMNASSNTSWSRAVRKLWIASLTNIPSLSGSSSTEWIQATTVWFLLSIWV